MSSIQDCRSQFSLSVMDLMEMIRFDDEDAEMIKSYGDGGEYWRRGRLLGEGSYGAVFMATSKDSEASSSCSRYMPEFPKVMAVKSAEISSAETLRLERRVLSHLSGCSSIIQCLGAEVTRNSDGTGIYNLLLEYGSGGTLEERLKDSGGGLPELEVRKYTRSIVEGLAKIHDAGFVHCDLKPENVLLCPTDDENENEFRAKICDFGLAKSEIEDRFRRRHDRFWKGTRWYLSPEALNEGMQEKSCDIWALGITVLEMLSGKRPWDVDRGTGGATGKVLRKLKKPGCVPEIPPTFSQEASSFLKSCLKRMAKNRATAKWLLRHPFINGIRVGRARPPENTTTSCISPSQLDRNVPQLLNLFQ